jgi:hypothetical protein
LSIAYRDREGARRIGRISGPIGSGTITMAKSLCETCQHVREIISAKGSRFLLCGLSHSDARFPKYPPQPMTRCAGYCERRAAEKA